jgi:branched-chain amino acid transport system substrate-binding protein
MQRVLQLLLLAVMAGASFFAGDGPSSASGATAPLRIGAVFPLHGPLAVLATDEYRGVAIARDMVNASGGISGHQVWLVTRELDMPDQSTGVMKSLHRQGISTVLGAYSSELSIPASTAAARDGMVYWEAGAVADRLTGRGLPGVFRVGASGSNLGSNSAHFAATQLAPRLHRQPPGLTISIVHASDAYAISVAAAAINEAHIYGMRIISNTQYDAYAPDWSAVTATVKRAHPNILILASHIPDGVAFRRAFLKAGIHVDAFIGSTMAQCYPEFGAMLGPDAVGVFASDRPPGKGFNPDALTPQARALYDRFAATWRKQTHGRAPTEEGLAGFSAAWALFHDVLPGTRASFTAASIERAARAVNLPLGSLPNGAGLRFAADRAHLGQNLRAAAVIWQWQAVRHSVVVWPKVYATGTVKMVPLPR